MVHIAVIVLVAALIFIVVSYLLFAPRSCFVEGEHVHIRTRLLTLKFSLQGLSQVEHVPHEAFSGWKMIRLGGFGWPFKPLGWFYNARFGVFLCLVNDPAEMCMLHLPRRRLLVSPRGGISAFRHTGLTQAL